MKYIILITLSFLVQHASAQCHTDAHTSYISDSWQSCNTSPSPNPARSNSHWILLDLGHVYQLGASHIWNYNVQGATNKGMKNIIIDYSTDGNNWSQATTTTVAQASGQVSYAGVTGPDLTGTTARYILISATDNWGHTSCAGLSEIKINVTPTTLGNHWIGVVSTEWDKPSNWGLGVVPNRYTNVLIPAGTPYPPIVNVHSKVNSLVVENGAELSVQSRRMIEICN